MAIKKLLTKSFLTRTVSGLCLILILALTAILGGDVFFGFVFALSMIGLFEVYRVAGMEKTPLAIVGYISGIAYFALIRFAGEGHFLAYIIATMIAVMAVYVFTFPKYSTEKVIMAVFGVIYVPVMMSYMYLVRNIEDGAFFFWLIFVASWACDTCAYLAGVVCGKHKMAPILSPKKTIEGAVGGVIGAALIGVVYGLCVRGHITTISENMVLVLFALIGAVGGLISMIGDLFASAIKRNYDIKDYGRLIPGHGGVMDRFDSVIITAPIIYYIIMYLGNI